MSIKIKKVCLSPISCPISYYNINDRHWWIGGVVIGKREKMRGWGKTRR
jgi:hypothetical protein